ncbi:MAG: macro domain-containing protein [Pseudobutyrivibrio sp.]|nr:macro domain-containing protein [Pseudobutyrivibrio sp.]
MKIYLLDWNQDTCSAWESYFNDKATIVCDEFRRFMNTNGGKIDGVVSPANCFGIMDGGYDAAITKYYGPSLMWRVQERLLQDYMGIQPIASCLSVQIEGALNEEGNQVYLLHTPVMTAPEKVREPRLIFHAMRNTLLEAKRLNLKEIVIPAWGGACGSVDPDIIAYYMWQAYENVYNPSKIIDWMEMDKWQRILNKKEVLLDVSYQG